MSKFVCQKETNVLLTVNKFPPGGGVTTTPNWVGVCRWDPQTLTLFQSEIVKNHTLFQSKIAENHTLIGGTSPYSEYRGVPPTRASNTAYLVTVVRC